MFNAVFLLLTSTGSTPPGPLGSKYFIQSFFLINFTGSTPPGPLGSEYFQSFLLFTSTGSTPQAFCVLSIAFSHSFSAVPRVQLPQTLWVLSISCRRSLLFTSTSSGPQSFLSSLYFVRSFLFSTFTGSTPPGPTGSEYPPSNDFLFRSVMRRYPYDVVDSKSPYRYFFSGYKQIRLSVALYSPWCV